MNTWVNTEKDTLNRERIRTELGRNFFVEASAGSGKTTLLVDRMVAMVCDGIDVEKICAITYTRAAANEFYARFQKKLAEAAANEKLSAEKRKLCADARRNIDLCFTGTIDAFCARILHEHPAEAGVPSDTSGAAEIDLSTFYTQAYTDVLNGAFGEELQHKGRLFEELLDHPRDVFTANLPDFLQTRSRECIYSESKGLPYEFDWQCKRIMQALECIYERPEIIHNTKDNLKKADSLQKNMYILRKDWRSNLGAVITALKKIDGLALSCPPDAEGIGIEDTALFEKSGKRVITYVLKLGSDGGFLRELTEIRFSAAVDFMRAFVKTVPESLISQGHVSFLDALTLLRDTLRRDAETGGKLIAHIAEKHRYYLIDEFQDTHPLQAEIFFYLAAERPVADWQKCRPRPGSLFIVGDPKQSIYRFQGADISAFLRVAALFEGDAGERLGLYRNFRSVNKLCDSFNDIFHGDKSETAEEGSTRGIMSEETKYQSRYELIPDRPYKDLEGGLTGIHTLQTGTLTECDAVAALIARMVNDPEAKIEDGKVIVEKEIVVRDERFLRRIRYEDFMIITRRKTNLNGYASALRRLDIPCRVEGATEFARCPALITLATIYSALAAPNDPIAVYDALKTAAFGITEAQLLKWRAAGHKLSLFAQCPEEEAEHEAVRMALDRLNELRNGIREKSAAAACAYLTDTLKLQSFISSDNLEYAYYAFELLRDKEEKGELADHAAAAAFLKGLFEDTRTYERCMSLNESEDRVHLANLHKVKGLEAPIVILADPHYTPIKPSKHICTDENGSRVYFFSLPTGYQNAKLDTKTNSDIAEEEEKYRDAENDRLLYVAATRAKNMVICLTPAPPEEGKRKGRNEDPWARVAPKGIGSLESDAEAPELSTPEHETCDAESLYNEPVLLPCEEIVSPSYKTATPSHIRMSSKSSETGDEDNMRKLDVGDDRNYQSGLNAALLGTMAHRIMEVLVLSRNTADADNLVNEVVSEYEVFGNVQTAMTATLRGMIDVIRTGGYPQLNDAPQDILSELLSADEVHCELPFFEKDGDTLWHGIMDVVYKKDGKWHIVDYKTNHDPDALDEHYRAQLDAYRAAFRRLTGEEADAKTYHLGIK